MADREWTSYTPGAGSVYWGLGDTSCWCRHDGAWYVAGCRWTDKKQVVVKSEDLVTWELVTDSPAWDPGGGDYSSHTLPALVSFGGDLYYFPQSDNDEPGGGAGVYVSSDDGATWSLAAASPLGNEAPCGHARALVWSGQILLQLGYRGDYSDGFTRTTVREMWRSFDGETYERVESEGAWAEYYWERNLFAGASGAPCMYARANGDDDAFRFWTWDEGASAWSYNALTMADGEDDVVQELIDNGSSVGPAAYHNGVYYVPVWWYTVVGSATTNHNRVLWSDDGYTMHVFESDPAFNAGGLNEALVVDGTLYFRTWADESGDASYGPAAVHSIRVGSGENPTLGEATESPWYTFACTPYGSVLNRDSLSYDFNRILIFDLENGVLLPGVGYPFACTLSSTSPCAGSGMLPRSRFGGTTDGYVHEILDDTAWGLGAPAGLVAWPLAAGCTTTKLYIDTGTAEQHFPTDALIGLTIYVNDESGTVSDNDTGSVTLSSALSSAPSEGDTLLVAPMTCGLVWPEDRSADLHTPFRLALKVENDQQYGDGTKIEQDFDLDIWAAQDGAIDLDLGDPTETFEFDTTDLRQGKGMVYFPRHTTRASTIGLRFQPVGNGRIRVGKASLGIAASDTEEGRGA